jgi:alkanesulfonate monooxygenase SsuD/methylene tetrahydromethanopterin reductase-like flavin-dependent oxidoreductase (luciferase family)
MSAALSRMARDAPYAMAMAGFQRPAGIAEVLPKFREMAKEAGRDPDFIEITSFGLGEDVDRVKRLAEMGVARVVPMFPPEKADKVLPIADRWTNIMRQVNR